VTHADRASYLHHAVKLLENDYAQDLGHDEISEQIVINLKTVRWKMTKVMTMITMMSGEDDDNEDCSSGLKSDFIKTNVVISSYYTFMFYSLILMKWLGARGSVVG
jgi:hypothetical protein